MAADSKPTGKQSASPLTASGLIPSGVSGMMQKYLDRALGVLQKFNIVPRDDVPQDLIFLLDEVRYLDEPRVLAIATTIKHMSTFNALVREHVENINIGNR